MNTLKKTTVKTFLFGSLLLASCSSSQKLADNSSAHKSGKGPKFIDDITLAGNNANHISVFGSKNTKSAQYDPANANTLQVKYASLLNVLPQAISNFSLYSFIDEWYGVPYRFGGVDKSGIDCSAFVQRLYENVFRMSLVRTAFEQFNLCRMVWDTADLKEGDLVFFKIHSRRISHVGIYLMNNFFVHASVSQGIMISSLNDSYWQRFFAGAGQIPKNNG